MTVTMKVKNVHHASDDLAVVHLVADGGGFAKLHMTTTEAYEYHEGDMVLVEIKTAV
jgi:hypothetical protein